MTLRRLAPFALLLLAACDAQPAITSPVPCQERILAVRQSTSLNPEQSRTLANGFRLLSQAYADLDETDCTPRQKRQLDDLERLTADLSTLAAKADQVDKRNANSRAPDPAVMQLAADMQAFDDRLSVLRRELREMQASR